MARPSEFTEAIADAIVEHIADGKSLRSFCRLSEDMPNKSTVFRWLEKNESFRLRYNFARDAQADVLADECLDIADTIELGVKTKVTDKGTETWEGDMIEHRRLQVETRKWIAAKLKPKKYGDRLHQELTGEDGQPLVVRVIKFADMKPPEQKS
jgi:hypothetical protein